jgi:ABC-type bacteriocin/lantibiotic exporter with double-glycine peptidase domain
MKRRKQLDQSGCGIACIAMLTNKSYEEVAETASEVSGIPENGEKYTSTGQLAKLGKAHGVTIGCKKRKKFKGWVHLPNRAILAINPDSERKYWHWVVFYREPTGEGAYVLDPNPAVKATRRKDFGRIKPFAYLPIIESTS